MYAMSSGPILLPVILFFLRYIILLVNVERAGSVPYGLAIFIVVGLEQSGANFVVSGVVVYLIWERLIREV